jgi:hypothetical protein
MSLKGNNSLHSLAEQVSRLVDAGDLNRALRLVYDFVERIFTEPLCTSQVLGSRRLDELCLGIGSVNLAAIDRGSFVGHASSAQPVYVYVVTKLQSSGGHTRVIADFIKARPFARHVVLSTELAGRSETGCLSQTFASQAQVSFETARRQDDYLQRLDWLQRRLLEIAPKKVYLFNHHQDSVAVAALQPGMGFDVSFYHHADHHLCLGVFLPQAEHIDPHPMGYHHCRDELGIDNIFIPLTIEDKGPRSDHLFLRDGTLTTCTAARSNKIEIPYFVSYLDMVPELLKAAGGKHVHIGRLTPWALFRIRRGLKRLGIPADRFVYIPWVSSVWKALHEHHVDMYIASFPYGGGLTLIEAMGAGVPVVLHRHVFSRVLSSIDIAYPGVYSWREPSELLAICAKVTAEQLHQHSQLAREQYMRYHRQQVLAEVLNHADGIGMIPPALNDSFQSQRDEFATWLERQVSIGHLLRRFFYRFMRSVRSRFL